jgi:hypothetical protein
MVATRKLAVMNKICLICLKTGEDRFDIFPPSAVDYLCGFVRHIPDQIVPL